MYCRGSRVTMCIIYVMFVASGYYVCVVNIDKQNVRIYYDISWLFSGIDIRNMVYKTILLYYTDLWDSEYYEFCRKYQFQICG